MKRILVLVLILISLSALMNATETAQSTKDPVLRAMLEELGRSKAKLKLDDVAAPYYIEYSISDVDEFSADTAFGALRLENRTHARLLRVVVRVGSYKQDSYYGEGEGTANIAAVEDDIEALRRQLWLTTDRPISRRAKLFRRSRRRSRIRTLRFRWMISPRQVPWSRFCRW